MSIRTGVKKRIDWLLEDAVRRSGSETFNLKACKVSTNTPNFAKTAKDLACLKCKEIAWQPVISLCCFKILCVQCADTGKECPGCGEVLEVGEKVPSKLKLALESI